MPRHATSARGICACRSARSTRGAPQDKPRTVPRGLSCRAWRGLRMRLRPGTGWWPAIFPETKIGAGDCDVVRTNDQGSDSEQAFDRAGTTLRSVQVAELQPDE